MLRAAAGLRGKLQVIRTIASGRAWKGRGGEAPAPVAVPMKALGGSALLVRPGTSDLINAAAYQAFDLYLPAPQIRGEDLACICELGSNIGAALSALARRYPSATLVGVEPDEANLQIARANLAGLEERCTLIRSGIWDESVELVVTEETGRGAHGLTVRPRREGDPPELPSFGALTIDALLEAHLPGRTVDYMHVSIEGTEPRVFAAGGDWPERVRSLRVELHPYYGFRAEDCLALLQALGYVAWPDAERPDKWVYALRR
jgi:FkbM family methyltransferase